MKRPPTVLDAASTAGSFDTFLRAVKAGGLVTVLTRARRVTVFAPTDEACARYAWGTILRGESPGARERARFLVANHVVNRLLHFADLLRIHELETLVGDQLRVAVKDGIVSLGGAQVLEADMQAHNGVLHAIDTVLIPSTRSGGSTLAGSLT